MMLIRLVFFVVVFGGITGSNSACYCSNAAGNQDITASAGILVDLLLLERTTTRLTFQLTVSNTGDRPVLIVTDPVRLDGSRGAYVSLNEKNSFQLELAFRVYPPPSYTLLAPKTQVTFRRLEAGATYKASIVLNSPFMDTKPPWGEWQDTRPIDVARIQEVVAKVGILPDDPAIHDALLNVRASEGFEMVKSGPLKGKLLFEIQTTISSKILQLS